MALSSKTRELLVLYTLTSAFCAGIAVVLSTLNSHRLVDNLLISFSIGLTTCTLFAFFGSALNRRLPVPVVTALLIGTGLLIGLCIGGLLVAGDMFLLFRHNLSSPLIGVFFGIVGVAIFSARARVSDLNAELAMAKAREHEQQREVAEMHLKMLQAQIEPHFLFNTLSNAISLIRTDPDTAEQLLHSLTGLLRDSFQRTRAEHISLNDELSIIEAYLQIQQIRMGDRLQYSISADKSLRSFHMPPMLLQPLVENAVLHGVSAEGGRVDIVVTKNSESIEIDVIDNGVGLATHGSTSGTGSALTNIRKRLRLLYEGAASLLLLENKNGGVTATLSLPFEKPMQENPS